MKKNISLILAVIMIVAIFATGCSNNADDKSQADTTASMSDADTTAAEETKAPEITDDIPADLNFNNEEVTFLYWSDYTMKEFFSEALTGDLIGDEIFNRNNDLQAALGVTLNYVGEKGNDSNMTSFVKKAETDISSGACEYDIIAGYSRSAPAMSLNGTVKNLNEVNYLNFEKPWWPKELVQQCTINNKMFFCSGDISTNMLWMMIATFYNKSLAEKFSIENLYDVVRSGKWTLDKFISLTENTYTDLDGGGQKDAGDFFGFVLYNTNADALFNGAGLRLLDKNASNELCISDNINSQRTYDVIDKVGALLAGNNAYHENDTAVRDIFFTERSIFITDRVFIVAGKDNGKQGKIEFGYGILPQPKYDESQTDYCTNLGHPFTMYAISQGVSTDEKADMCGAVLEKFGYLNYKYLTPVVFEEAMKIKYADDDDASEMYDILRETVCFDMGRFYNKQAADIYKTLRTCVFNNVNNFASSYKVLEKSMNTGLKQIAAAYED